MFEYIFGYIRMYSVGIQPVRTGIYRHIECTLQNVRRELVDCFHILELELLDEILDYWITLKSRSTSNTPYYTLRQCRQTESYHIRRQATRFDNHEHRHSGQFKRVKLDKCINSQCRRGRSSRPLPKDAGIVERLVCGRDSCATFKLSLKEFFDRYCDKNTPNVSFPTTAIELPGESRPPIGRVELPGEVLQWTPYSSLSQNQIHSFHEGAAPTPPLSTKPTVGLVEKIRRQNKTYVQ
jgi:hypothetical protein